MPYTLNTQISLPFQKKKLLFGSLLKHHNLDNNQEELLRPKDVLRYT